MRSDPGSVHQTLMRELRDHGDVWMPIRRKHGGWRDTQLARAHVQAAARALGVRVATRRVGAAIHGVVGDPAARAATR